MSMSSDPHETSVRRTDYSKDASQEKFLDQFNQALYSFDFPVLETNNRGAGLPLIYIVGAPRSGTTLLSQLSSRFLPVGYINNLIARFWLKPSIGINLSKAVLTDVAREHISLISTHGSTIGVENPHEFGYFWRYWLDLDHAPNHHLSGEHLNGLNDQGLKNALENEILAAFDAPVIFKNVICGFHASFLTHIHPASLFVYISRDPYHVAASVLKVRKERYGSYNAWWSLKPSTYPYDFNDPVAEVARQVIDCRKEIEAELSKPGVISIRIHYEDLCRNPQLVMETICENVKVLGYDMQPISAEIPQLAPAAEPTLPREMAAQLRFHLSSF